MYALNPLAGFVLVLTLSLGLLLLYRRWRHTLPVKLVMLALWSALTAFSAHAFYDRYWIWQDCFNELGRCYDTEAGVMVEQAGPIWTLFTAVFGFFFLRALWRLRPSTIAAAAKV